MHTDREHDLRHHGDAEVRDGGSALVDLAVNVRTGTPPVWLREHVAGALGSLAAYPDGRAARSAVAARHGLPVERVLLTAGAAEAFVLLARALKVRRPVVIHPQFTEPELLDLVMERYEEAVKGDLRMNCDTCVYRIALPGFEDKVGMPQQPHFHPDDEGHHHGGHHHDGHHHGHPHSHAH